MVDKDKPSIMTLTYVLLRPNKDGVNFTNDFDIKNNSNTAVNFTNENDFKNNSNTANFNYNNNNTDNTSTGNSTSPGSRYCLTDLQSIMADQGAQEFGNGVN